MQNIPSKTVVIVQAHMMSSRLPGKVMLDICGKTMLERVVERCLKFRQSDEVVVATSSLRNDDIIENLCDKIGIRSIRGSEHDVLDRFYSAAKNTQAGICIRITSDCPLIDPTISDAIIGAFKIANPKVDYASNKIPQSYPRGLDTEVFTFDALEKAWTSAGKEYQRRHVTCYLYENPQRFHLLSIKSTIDRSNWRWCVDTHEDYEFIKQIYLHLGEGFTWIDVLALIEEKPQLMEINSHVRQKTLIEG